MMVPCSAHRTALYTGDVAELDIVAVLYGAGANLNGTQKSASDVWAQGSVAGELSLTRSYRSRVGRVGELSSALVGRVGSESTRE